MACLQLVFHCQIKSHVYSNVSAKKSYCTKSQYVCRFIPCWWIKVCTIAGSMDVSVCLSLKRSISKAGVGPSHVTATTAHNLYIDHAAALLRPTRNRISKAFIYTPSHTRDVTLSDSFMCLSNIQIIVFMTWTACARCASRGCFMCWNCVFCAMDVSFKKKVK